MTAQIGDRIFINNTEHTLACEPLSRFLYDNKIEKLFSAVSTACYRGYFATWKINNGKIYLLDIEAPRPLSRKKQNESKEPISAMQMLFPGQSKVFACWISGELKIESGEILQYIHDGYESVYQTDIFLKFENGVLIDEKTINNTSKE
jgi:hypothetical protein